jgi:hypothetical protein
MSEIWKPLTIETYQYWVKTIISENQDALNDWETNFIDSIDNQLASQRNLSQRQAEILERIYSEKTK